MTGELWSTVTEGSGYSEKEIKIQKELIVKGKSRIQEKTKEIRQSFSKAVVSG